MIPKVAHYGGFQSYGDKHYSSAKPGSQSLDMKCIWSQSSREQDKMAFHNSFNRNISNYKAEYGQNVSQKDYVDVKHVLRGSNGGQNKDRDMRTVGTQNWTTTYGAQLTKPIGSGLVKQPDWATDRNVYQVVGNGAKSEYKSIYGELGELPKQINDRYSQRQLLLDNELRLGSSQMSHHTPGYQGFIPAVKTYTPAFEQSLGLKERNTFLKQNILDNQYKIQISQLRIPNYTGHLPKHYSNQKGTFRENFFSLKGEKYH